MRNQKVPQLPLLAPHDLVGPVGWQRSGRGVNSARSLSPAAQEGTVFTERRRARFLRAGLRVLVVLVVTAPHCLGQFGFEPSASLEPRVPALVEPGCWRLVTTNLGAYTLLTNGAIVEFGGVSIGQQLRQTVSLGNNFDHSLLARSITITNHGGSVVATNLGFCLAAAQTLPIHLHFAPTVEGVHENPINSRPVHSLCWMFPALCGRIATASTAHAKVWVLRLPNWFDVNTTHRSRPDGEWVSVTVTLPDTCNRVGVWGSVHRVGNRLFADAQTDVLMGGICLFGLVAASHDYRLPSLGQGRYEVIFSAFGVPVRTFSINVPEPPTEADGDGISDWNESRADTNPWDSNSVLRMAGIEPTPQALRLKWQGGRRATQVVQQASLVEAGAIRWTDIFTNHPSTEVDSTVMIRPAPGVSGFFRVEIRR